MMDSTNGCAVIAPLLVNCHITGTLSNVVIDDVIDNISPPIIYDTREIFGLAHGEFLVRKGVHFYPSAST